MYVFLFLKTASKLFYYTEEARSQIWQDSQQKKLLKLIFMTKCKQIKCSAFNNSQWLECKNNI